MYEYDANGSQTKKITKTTSTGTPTEEVTYRYNLQNRLSRVITDTDPAGSANLVDVTDYTYNPSGIRTSKYNFSVAQNYLDAVDEQSHATGKVTTLYVIDPANPTGYAQVLEEWTYDMADPVFGTSTPSAVRYYTLGDDVIAQTDDTAATGEATYLLYDGHGSTRLLLDHTYTTDNGKPVTRDSYNYDGYGVMLSSGSGADAASTAAQSQTSLLYAGEQYDGSLGQYYLRARYYNPANGLFNRMDPYSGNMQDPKSLHKYAYCHANPVNGSDPSGLFMTMSETMATTLIIATLCMNLLSAVMPLAFGVAAAWMMGVSPGEFFAALCTWETWAIALKGLGYGMIMGILLEEMAKEFGKIVMIWIGFFLATWNVIQSAFASWQMIKVVKELRAAGITSSAQARKAVASYIAVLTASIVVSIVVGKILSKIQQSRKQRTELKSTMNSKDKKQRMLGQMDIDGDTVTVRSGNPESKGTHEYGFETNPKEYVLNPPDEGGNYHVEHKLANIAIERQPDDYSGTMTWYLDESPCQSNCQPLINTYEEGHPNIQVEIFYTTQTKTK